MDFSSTIKIFVFISCLILFVDESQGGTLKDNYIILRPREARRLSQIMRMADFQIAANPWKNNDIYDQMTKKTESGIATANLKQEISDSNRKVDLTPIGTRPSIELYDEPMEFRRLPVKQFLSTNYIPIDYFN